MPLPSNDNLFVIPSLIPPLTSSSALGSKNLGGKENDRKYTTNIINNRTKNGNGTTMQSSSLLHHPSKQHRQDVISKTGKALMSSSPNVNNNINKKQSHHLRRSNPKQTKRKALSPIEIISSSSSSSSTKKINKGKNSPFSSSPSYASPAPAIPISSSSSASMPNRSGKKRVLLFGETIESLFCLNKISNTNDEHYQLCRGIVDGPCTDDPGAWRRVLEMAWNSSNNGAGTAAIGSSRKENLIRLHRRATLRFSLSDQQKLQEEPQSSSSSSSNTNRRRNIFEIWLSFAKTHATVGNLDEARRTFRFMENNEKALLDFSSSTELEEGIGSAAKFYMSYANFESNYCHENALARQILLRGIKRKAEPIQKLEKALKVLRSSSNNDHEEDVTRQFRTNNGIRAVEKHQQSPSLSVKADASQIIRMDHRRSPRAKPLIMDNVVQKSSQKELSSPSKHQQKNQLVEKGNNNNNNNNNDNDNDVDGNRIKITTETSSKIMNKAGHHYTNGSPTPMSTLNRSTSKGKPPVSKKRPSLTSRLARNRLSGKAKRVDCSINIDDDDDDSSSDDETNNERACTTQDTDDLSLFNKPEASSKPGESKSDKPSKVPSFKKVDLSYMWAWDPSAKGKDQNHPTEKSSDASNSTGSGQSTFATHVTASGTQGSGGSSSGELSTTSAAKKTPAQSQIPSRAQEGDRSDAPGITVGVIEKESADVDRKEVEYDDKKRLQSDPSMSRRQELIAKANLEFLPLVHEDNILRVRDSTYAKLGVIGKGGSCKVYRALSKKCSVVAIKKVKLAGMDAKAIEGYANEISLLKRLRGNPAIIQMYDSEVDLHRKSIFVVMELGEVDLNHVLQQRALNDTSRSLNMNFIRLTWQQMLSAVHCIHEERIIHSDLKPANFLFVRGALKLIDFGIAKAIANDDTTNIYRENHIGTLNYMSPESILDTGSGEDGARMRIGRPSDVWSLGCILYEMVYGKTPFAKLHFIQKLQAIVNTSHAIHFPEDEEAEAAIDAMKQCLCRNPEERPPIIGKHGLLNEHWFLHSKRRASL